MSLNLRFKMSSVFETADFWHNKEGINKNTIKLLNREFNLYRGLFPIRILLRGPPASGKSYYA